jgi:hypothetical protein
MSSSSPETNPACDISPSFSSPLPPESPTLPFGLVECRLFVALLGQPLASDCTTLAHSFRVFLDRNSSAVRLLSRPESRSRALTFFFPLLSCARSTRATFTHITSPTIADYGPRYIGPFKAAIGLIAIAIALLVPLWWILDGDISKSAWLTEHVQSQTHYRDGDEKRERVEEVLAAKECERREGSQEKV